VAATFGYRAATVVGLTGILHLPYTFAPDPCGGTEIYVESLAKALRARGCAVAIAAPGVRNEAYAVDGIPVFRFRGTAGNLTLENLYGAGDPVAAESFESILDRQKPEIVHLHAFTSAVSVRLVKSVRQRNIPIVFTYHTPTVSCQRGTLMEWGKRACDGEISVRRCAACSLHGLGFPAPAAKLLGSLPKAVGAIFRHAGLEGHLFTTLRMTELVQHRQAAFREILALLDHIVAPSLWVRDVLARNGADLRKVSISRQGITPCRTKIDQSPKTRLVGQVRFACLARFNFAKGLEVIIDALRLIPDANLSVDVYGIAQGSADKGYLRDLERSGESDSRIRFHTAFSREECLDILKCYDALLVPSICLETGPLVVLEAFAAGLPVIGSRLGGIAERVRDGVDGVLIDPGNVRAWANVMHQFAEQPDLLSQLRADIRSPRTMEHVADEMLEIYRCVSRRSSPQAHAPV
jgi:glycosyltransferase involved in cell wall biosynthesis